MGQHVDNLYTDTRGRADAPVPFTAAVLEGLAPGGGLFVPQRVPRFTDEQVAAMANAPYWRCAAQVYKAFGVDLSDETVDRLMREAYGKNFDDERVCPLVPVDANGQRTDVLELWHGPTAAFKDMALQCLPRFFSAAAEKQREEGTLDHDFLVLVATSGDTGGAALAGFAGVDHVKVGVMYPAGGVSDVQRLQMTSQEGDNLDVWAVQGNFDDCQRAEKQAFADQAFNRRLLADCGRTLSSANSINWGRLLPQVVYYLRACAQMRADGRLAEGELVDVCVPTGNFGDILAAWYAKRAGAPIDRLICASNENRVLADFISTGTYDISRRPFVRTPSPAMDILVSSNLERLLFELTDHDGAKVAGWMDQLAREKRFSVDRQTFERVRAEFSADSVGNDDCLATIRRVHERTGRLLDPHTAVAWEVGERLRSDRPLMVVSTASWAKFGENVYRALHGIAYGALLPADVAGMDGVALDRLVAKEAAADLPRSIARLDGAKARFTQEIPHDIVSVEDAVATFARA